MIRQTARNRRPGMVVAFAAVIGLGLAAVPNTATAADQTLVRTAAADTYVVATSPTSSFGSESVLKISRTTFHAFIGFNPGLPTGSTLTSASLRLYAIAAPDTGGFAVHPAAGSWSESTTWADRPTWDSSVIATSPTPADGAWVDVALPVDAVPDAGPVSWGLAYSVAGVIVRVASSEDAAHAPQLTLTYQEAGGTGGGPADAPTVANTSVSGVTNTSASVSTVVDGHANATTCSFEYGTTTAYGSSTTVHALPAATGSQSISDTLTGLRPDTAYNVRATCTNAGGTASGGSATFRTPPVGSRSGGRVTKVLTIVEENHGYDQMLAGMPNLKSLATRYGYATNYDALTHPSLPNYLALAAGSTFGVTSDCGVSSCPQGSTTVFDQAIAAGRTAGIYAEDMTSNCQQSGSGAGLYAVRHTAWPYFTNATSRKNCLAFQVPSGTAGGGPFHDDVVAGNLPNVGWLIPNLCNDAHDSGCTLRAADGWLSDMLDLVFASPDWKSGQLAVVITADEDDGSQGNQVLTVVAHPDLSGVTVGTHLDHYSLTRFQEDVAGVSYLGRAAGAADLAAAFGLTTG